jgi:hypothetical protein
VVKIKRYGRHRPSGVRAVTIALHDRRLIVPQPDAEEKVTRS